MQYLDINNIVTFLRTTLCAGTEIIVDSGGHLSIILWTINIHVHVYYSYSRQLQAVIIFVDICTHMHILIGRLCEEASYCCGCSQSWWRGAIWRWARTSGKSEKYWWQRTLYFWWLALSSIRLGETSFYITLSLTWFIYEWIGAFYVEA